MTPFDAEALAHHRRLAARMASGDSEALQLLFLELAAIVHGVARHVLEEPNDARDVVQETFVRAWREAVNYRPESGEVESWLLLLAREVAIERTKKGARRARLGEGAVRAGALAEGTKALTPQERDAIELAFFRGQSPTEISAAMQTTTATAAGYLRDALRKIRSLAGAPADDELAAELSRLRLGELEAARRTALSARIEREPALAAEVGRCADALARFACASAPPESLTPAAQRAALTMILAACNGHQRARDGAIAGARKRGAPWVVIALGLLTLNGFQLWRASRQSDLRTLQQAEGDVASEARKIAAEEMRRVEKLRADYASLRQSTDALRAEYDNVVSELAERSVPPPGVSRLIMMELVDAASYGRSERRGLTTVARGLLTSPGIVAVAPAAPRGSTPTPAADAGQPTAALSASTERTKDTLPPVPTLGAVRTEEPKTVATAAGTGSLMPYAWLVFDEAEGRGFLNLYHLPALAADQVLRVWARSGGAAEFVATGDVPSQFYGRSGNVEFRLPDGAGAPVEILVTFETRGRDAEIPSSVVLLHGP